jgi:hypothetical protein
MPYGQSLLRHAALVAVALTTTTLLLSAAPGGDPDREGVPHPGEEEIGVLRVSIEKAFSHCNADPLKPALSRRTKTYVALSSLGVPDGYYGADQMLLLLRRMFDDRTTIRLAIAEQPRAPRTDGLAVLTASWVYREKGSAKREIKIAFVLASEGTVWRIREVRGLK